MPPLSTPVEARAAQSWLTFGRIRRQALLLAIALWVGYALNMSSPGMRDRFGHLKGADFLHSYILGTLALDHLGDALYDPRIQRDIGDARVPESSGDYFLPVYPPQYSLFWLPFAKLPYAWAAAIWIFLSAAIYAACCYAIWRTCPNLRSYGGTVALCAVSFPGFYELINFGQNSALALACFTGMYFALRARRDLLAGLCLGLLAYKPQLGLVPACLFLFECVWPRKMAVDPPCFEAVRLQEAAEKVTDARSVVEERPFEGRVRPGESTRALAPVAPVADPRRSRMLLGAVEASSNLESMRVPAREAWKVVLGALLAIAAQIGVVWLWYGSGPLLNYFRVVTHLGSAAKILEPKPYLMHSLRAFWDLLLPWPNVALAPYIPTAVAAVVLAIVCWRRSISLEYRFAVMLLATVLVAPHLTVYDLVILAPALLWIADWLPPHASPVVAWLLYLSCLLPFAGQISRWTHVQFSVISLAALSLIFAKEVWREGEGERETGA